MSMRGIVSRHSSFHGLRQFVHLQNRGFHDQERAAAFGPSLAAQDDAGAFCPFSILTVLLSLSASFIAVVGI